MEDIGAIIVGRFPLASGEWIPPHSHTHHQLAWTRRGVLGVGVAGVYWVLPPTRALWLPAGVTHTTGATRDAVLCSLYLAPEQCPLDWPEPTAVGIDGLLAELIEYLARGDLDAAARSRAEALLPDLLRPLPTRPIDVPAPSDERVQVVAAALLANPADQRSLSAHALAAGVSRRTMTRLFVHDTGMSFDQWRTQVRLRASLPLLAEGQPVSRVAHSVGYATASAFLAAFRRTVGTTPRRYLFSGRA
ncbi:AraC family transcriptional regulator [Prauserella marina]|uniref:HTH-type transcriptional regulator RipA n=1 Tax=Prauserella marina TaxID=530584 RepID=A0A222VQP7_9PSEU|nr:AraC family transcriptional regulator [Prauserella marina]ASR36214.1 AraC family transcriptional regulator [Prauserella marina]PWV76973.1 AraC-like DNA-binding protein [Prauserella marina]SDD01453.1 AraC-type DNA-binding protein [Prauserella marina]